RFFFDPRQSGTPVRQGDIPGVMSALLPSERLPITAAFGGSRDWTRSLGVRRSLLQAGYSEDVAAPVIQSVRGMTRPAGRATLSAIKGLSAEDHAQILAALSGLPEGYNGAYGAHLLVHLAGLGSDERGAVLTNAQCLTPEQMGTLAGLVGD